LSVIIAAKKCSCGQNMILQKLYSFFSETYIYWLNSDYLKVAVIRIGSDPPTKDKHFFVLWFTTLLLEWMLSLAMEKQNGRAHATVSI